MKSKIQADGDAARRRRRLAVEVKDGLGELRIQLFLLSHQVGAQVDLKDADLHCLDLVTRHGPLSPGALAKRAGVHPATMTGVLDRLERGGWIIRDRDPADRRAVLIRALRDRSAELYRALSGMNSAMDELCAGYGEAELALIADFLRRTAQAGERAAGELSDGR